MPVTVRSKLKTPWGVFTEYLEEGWQRPLIRKMREKTFTKASQSPLSLPTHPVLHNQNTWYVHCDYTWINDYCMGSFTGFKDIFAVVWSWRQINYEGISLWRGSQWSLYYSYTTSCIASNPKIKNWFLLSVWWKQDNHNVLEDKIPSFLSTVCSSCSERLRWRVSRGREVNRSGRSPFLASTPLWAPYPLKSNGGGVPDRVLHRICRGNVNGEGVSGVWSVELWKCSVQRCVYPTSGLCCFIPFCHAEKWTCSSLPVAQAALNQPRQLSEIYAG